MLILNGKSLVMLILCISFLFSLICYVKAREVDGSDNNLNQYSKFGASIQPFQRNFPPQPFYGPDGNSMIQCPSDIVFTDSTKPIPKCTDPLPVSNFPMPRCISNIITNYRTEKFNLKQMLSYRSKRHASHMATFFSYFISSDIIQSKATIKSIPIYIPSDDSIYNPSTGQPNNITQIEFNRTEPVDNLRNGLNYVTPFLDLNQLYGLSKEESTQLRDIGNRGKLKIDENNQLYPLKDPVTGDYILGQFSNQTNYIFTLAIHVIWLREHNRLCDQLYITYGDSWTDSQYFEEARRWNIAFYQKVVEEEYFGEILGRPLPPYKQYDENLIPGIDVFFETITFKHSHSELSNKYHIQDEFGDPSMDLTLDDILTVGLLEKFGIGKVLRSMSLQHQEDSDIYYSDAVRNYKTIEQLSYDMVAFSVLRARDRGIALYNDVRQAYGLAKKESWADITSVKVLQDYLQQLYPDGPNQLEVFVGAMVEDHLNGSNFGELMSTSMVTQFVNIRDSDRFWYENSIMFTDNERKILRNTTFRDIIVRNLQSNYESSIPQNIWMVQPASTNSLKPDDEEYPNDISAWPLYSVKYRVDDTSIFFKVNLQTSDGEGWFGMGFDPEDDGMKGADFVIGIVEENNTVVLYNYRASSAGYNTPSFTDNLDLEIINNPPLKNNIATIEFSRPLLPNGKKGIKRGSVKYLMAYNPESSQFSYHTNNRIMMTVDFYQKKIDIVEVTRSQQRTKLIHGVAMGLTWSVVFPISIFVVRFFKHTDHYVKIHRFFQLAGGISIGGFGAAVLSVADTDHPHSLLGLTLYSLVFLQLAIGMASIWGQAYLVSVNIGYSRGFKRGHKYLGISLLIIAWVNICLGMDTYSESYGEDLRVYKFIYFAWISLVVLTFIIYEVLHNLKFKKRNIKYIKLINNQSEHQIIDNISNEKYESLPFLTLDEFNDKVQKGAHLVICDEFIVDIRTWIINHPGGAKILENAIGTDITDDFYGKKNIDQTTTSRSFSRISSSPSAIKLKRKSKFDYGIIETIEKSSFATIVDDFNKKHIMKSSLAAHSHSYVAIVKLSKMIIARYNTSLFKDPIFHKLKFKRFKLIEKSIVNNSHEFPIVKFIFICNNDYGTDLDYLPGHYIEVQTKIQGQVANRNYTPIDGKIMRSFCILVKIYPNSLMSKHLNDLLVGFEILVRGPFELGDRILSADTTAINSPVTPRFPRESILQNNNHVPATPINSLLSSSSIFNNMNNDRIDVDNFNNNSNGCWDNLYMICGGTGITPMIQLIKYHLRHFDNADKLSMHLFYANNSFDDQILNLKELYMGPLHEQNVLANSVIDNVLSIVRIFKKLPASSVVEGEELQQIRSTALKGKIDKKNLKNWFKDIITKNELKKGKEMEVEKNVIPNDQSQSLSSSSFPPIQLATLPSSPLSNNKQSTETNSLNSDNDNNELQEDQTVEQDSNEYIRDLLNKPNSKIFVCGPMEMINKIGDILSNDMKLKINDDYVLLI